MTDLILLAAILSVPASIVSLIAFPRRIAQLAGFGPTGDAESAGSRSSALARELTLAPDFTLAGESAAA